ncbi:MAG: arylesterase [Betaproteobacteria bacterium]|nr:arylesterase [Betaproteobacteria bacterium]
MRLIRAAVSLALLAALLGACGGSAPKLAPLASDAVVLAFGDSITAGTGANAVQSYPSMLASLIARKVESAGVPGETSAAGLARLPEMLDYYRPQLVIICEGGNDFLRKLGEKQAADNIRAMVRTARDKGVAVLLVAVPKPGLLPSPPDFYEEIAAEFRIPLEAAALKRIMRDNELKSDLVHPNAKGYAELARSVAEVLKKSGAI